MEPIRKTIDDHLPYNTYKKSHELAPRQGFSGAASLVPAKQPYKPISVIYSTHPRSNLENQPTHNNSIPYKTIWYINRNKEDLQKKKFYGINIWVIFQQKR